MAHPLYPLSARFPQEFRQSCFSLRPNIDHNCKSKRRIGKETSSQKASLQCHITLKQQSPYCKFCFFYCCTRHLDVKRRMMQKSRAVWADPLTQSHLNHKSQGVQHIYTHKKKRRCSKETSKHFSFFLYSRFFFCFLLLLHFSLCPKNFTTAIEQLVSLGVLLYTYTQIYKGKHSLLFPLFFRKRRGPRASEQREGVVLPLLFSNRKKINFLSVLLLRNKTPSPPPPRPLPTYVYNNI